MDDDTPDDVADDRGAQGSERAEPSPTPDAPAWGTHPPPPSWGAPPPPSSPPAWGVPPSAAPAPGPGSTPPPPPPPPASAGPPPPPPPPAWGGAAGPPPGAVYGNPYGYGATGLPRSSGLAIASLVLGICGFLYCVPALVGLPLGYAAKKQIRESEGTVTGEGMATAGIVLGWVWVGLGSILLVIYVLNRSRRG